MKKASFFILLTILSSSLLAQSRYARKTPSASYIKSQIYNDARIEAEAFLAKYGFQNFEINGSVLVDENYNVIKEFPNTEGTFQLQIDKQNHTVVKIRLNTSRVEFTLENPNTSYDRENNVYFYKGYGSKKSGHVTMIEVLYSEVEKLIIVTMHGVSNAYSLKEKQ